MKRISKYIIIAILLLSSGCQTLFNWTIKPVDDFFTLYLFNAIFIDNVAKYVTCYYCKQDKFPASHIDILPIISNNSIDDIKLKDNLVLKQDTSFTGIAKYNFKLSNYTFCTLTTDSIDSHLDSMRIYKSIGTIAFIDSIFYKTEKAFIVEIIITDINGSLYWNKDSTYFDDYSSNHFLNSSDNRNFIKDTIQINRSCQKGDGLEIQTEQQ